jgi:tight adherence protein B
MTQLLIIVVIVLLLVILGVTLFNRPSRAAARLRRHTDPLAGSSDILSARRPFDNLWAAWAALFRLGRQYLSARGRARVKRSRESGNIEHQLADAGLRLRPDEFLLLWAAVAVILPLTMLILGSLLPPLNNQVVVLAALVAGVLAPRYWLHQRVQRRFDAFNTQLPDTIFLLANTLRAGNSFSQALDLIIEESAGTPNAVELARVNRQMRLGFSIERAMEDLGARIHSEDLDLMITAILVNHVTGGNLAEILDTIALTIREHIRLKGEVRAHTAAQRLSSWILEALPLVLFAILSLTSPHYIKPFFVAPPGMFGIPLGLIILGFTALMTGLGILIIRRIGQIEV